MVALATTGPMVLAIKHAEEELSIEKERVQIRNQPTEESHVLDQQPNQHLATLMCAQVQSVITRYNSVQYKSNNRITIMQ